jgi:hypothetical protein
MPPAGGLTGAGVSRPAAASASIRPEFDSGATRTRLAKRLRAIELRLQRPNEPPSPAGATSAGMGGSATGGESLAISSTAEGSTDTAAASASAAGTLGSGSGGCAACPGVAVPFAASAGGLCSLATRTGSFVGTLRGTALAYSAVVMQPETVTAATTRTGENHRDNDVGRQQRSNKIRIYMESATRPANFTCLPNPENQGVLSIA